MKKIIITESQYKRLVSKRLNEEITEVGDKVSDFDVDLEGSIVRRWEKNNPNHVERIQKMLVLAGYRDELSHYGIDGKFGPHTEEAVTEFQKEVFADDEIEWDGEIGPKTYKELYDITKEVAEENNISVDNLLSLVDDDWDNYLVASDEDVEKAIEDEGEDDYSFDGIDDYSFDDIDVYLKKKDPLVKGSNGNLTLDDLTYVGEDVHGNKEYLSKDAAIMFKKMKEDALKDGIKIKLSDAYRPCGRPGDYERYKKGGIRYTQWAAWEDWGYDPAKAAKPKPSTDEKWLKSGGKCTSNHGWGKAIDINSGAYSWVEGNGAQYGFVPYAAEDWHFDFKKHKVAKEFKHLINSI